MAASYGGPFALLRTLPDPAAADLCAALLRSAGIEALLRGESLGPYRLSVGAMAATEVWVPADCLDDARAVLAGVGGPEEWEGGDEGGDAVSPAAEPGPPAGRQAWWPAGAALLLALLALVAWLVISRAL
jgi:hypothetical protein